MDAQTVSHFTDSTTRSSIYRYNYDRYIVDVILESKNLILDI